METTCLKFQQKDSVTPKVLIVYLKHLFKLRPKSISKFLKGWTLMKIIVPKLFFVSLPSDPWQFQNQLMTKSETHLGFRPSENH